jgi:hypothetical protein
MVPHPQRRKLNLPPVNLLTALLPTQIEQEIEFRKGLGNLHLQDKPRRVRESQRAGNLRGE